MQGSINQSIDVLAVQTKVALILLRELVSRHVALIVRLSLGILGAHNRRLAGDVAHIEFRLTVPVPISEESGDLYTFA